MSKQAVRHRKQKEQEGVGKPVPKEKFIRLVSDTQSSKLPELKAMTNNQKLALRMFMEDRHVVFLTGSAGTGKSMLAAYAAARKLLKKEVSKIYLIRPAVSVGKSIGLLPGTMEEKMLPYFAQTLTHLEKFIGKGPLEHHLRVGNIIMKPAEYLRGMSFENCFVIIEESQNFTFEEFEMVLTRLGEDCNLVFTGDQAQHDLKGTSGLTQTVTLLRKMQDNKPEFLNDEEQGDICNQVGIVEFTPDDVVRSGLTKAFVHLYHYTK